MDDLIAKIRAAVDEMERIALAANHEGHWDTSGDDGPAEGVLYAFSGDNPKDGWKIAEFTLYPDGVANSPSGVSYLPAYSTMPVRHIENAVHAAHQDPKRTLSMVKAHRKILDIHSGPHSCGFSDYDDAHPCGTLLALAEGHEIGVPDHG